MKILSFPTNQLLFYELTGKFKASAPNWKHAILALTDYELFVVTEGTLFLTYNKQDFTVESGHYLLLEPSNSLRQGFREAYSSFYWLHFSVPALPNRTPDEAVKDALFSIPQTGVLSHPEKIVVLMKQLQDFVKNKYPQITLNAMATSVLTALYGQLLPYEAMQQTSISQKQIYSDIIDYLHSNLSINLKVSDIADHFGYNETYLSHLIGTLVGIPLKRLIIQHKMETANFMLTDTNSSIQEIAESVGFQNSHNFSRAYKNYTGLTPSQYRSAFSKRLLYDR
ncbi:MAG: hypothetical protein PWP24_1119 [Clostridiales bacterium]|nr:hypothetical protein [Clostridiales bacterium]